RCARIACSTPRRRKRWCRTRPIAIAPSCESPRSSNRRPAGVAAGAGSRAASGKFPLPRCAKGDTDEPMNANPTDPTTWTISAAGAALAGREISAVELARRFLDRVHEVEPRLHALLTVTEERMLVDARAADERLDRGERGPLLGIPVVLKDIFATRGIATTCGSRILEGFLPPYDGDAAERLARAGAVLIGKSNLDEFAMGSSTENSAFGVTRNPWALDRVPGGSSGGSAAAVAAGECLAALGTDTGGSIRLPASYCGISGLKPTYGRVSRYGVVAYASSLDQVGPFARTVRDVASVLGVIAGHDPRDSTSVPLPVPDYVAALDGNLKGLRVGVPREYFVDGMA